MNKLNNEKKPVRTNAYLIVFGVASTAFLGYLWLEHRLTTATTQSNTSTDVSILYAEGLAAYKDKKYADALKKFHKIIQQKPHEQAYIQSSLAWAKLGDINQAITHADKAIAINKRNPSSHLMLGNYYLQQKQYDNAERSLLTASLLNNSLFEPFYFLTQLYTQMGEKKDLTKAIMAGKKAVSLRPNAKDAHAILAAAYLKADEFNKAQEQYQKILEQNPKDLDALLGTAKVYQQQKMPQEALTYANDALKIDPTFEKAQALKTELLSKQPKKTA